MRGLKSGQVALVPYDPAWVGKYARERRVLRDVLGSHVEDIQHIGSTAIPGMAAKPIIDIAVAVADIDTVESLVSLLEAVGYEYRGLLNGIEGHFFFRKGDPREFFLHVFAHQSDFWSQRLTFRDYLISHPDLASRYQALKRRLATEYPNDRSSYTAAKKAFIEEVTDLACGTEEDEHE